MCVLNKNQIQSINAIRGPCLILAGAGSGKTTVIVKKIIKLIDQYGYDAHKICAVTFTNRSAQEMKTRIMNEYHGIDYKSLNICTFHYLGMKIITESLDALGYRSSCTIFDRFDQIRLLKNIVHQDLRGNYVFLKKIIKYIFFQKNKIIKPIEAKRIAISQNDVIFSQYYEEYNKLLKKYNAFDFDDLIYMAVNLLKDHQDIQNRWQNNIKYLLVDEYQDTNYSQYQLIQLLSGHSPNFTLVGDDDQSIYSWRGAGVENIEFLKNDYPNLQVIKLEHNYRSSQRILKAANLLISNNFHVFQKKLFSNLDVGIKIKILQLQDEYDEVETVIQKILSHKTKFFGKLRDYAILYRTNQQSKIFEQYLFKKQIPYFIHGNNSFFIQPEIKLLISYLKFIVNQSDNITLLKIINTPARNIGLSTIKKIVQYAEYNQKSFFEVLLDPIFQKTLTPIIKNRIYQFIFWMKEIIESAKRDPKNVLLKIINDIKYKEWLFKKFKNHRNVPKYLNNVQLFLDMFVEFFNSHIEKDTVNFYNLLLKFINQIAINDINMLNENNNSNIKKDYIHLMTIHASKGLEFSSVYITGFEEGIIPSICKNLEQQNISEERRLLYVAITRAKKELTLSFCQKRCLYGTVIKMSPSRFLYELPKNDLIWENYC